MMPNFKAGDIVSVPTTTKEEANTYLVDSVDLNTKTVLVYHTCYPSIFFRYSLEDLERESCKPKGLSEEALIFCFNNKDYLDFEDHYELTTLLIHFAVKRIFPDKMKASLSNLGGKIARKKLGKDVHKAIDLVVKNKADLDKFNRKWYDNLYKLFSGTQPITSEKQRVSIFNIAGFILGRFKSFESMDD